MPDLEFEWDERKSRSNKKKHGVSFDEARSVFFDDNAMLIADPEHSQDEARFILMGLGVTLRVLVVCHCYRRGGDVIRIISARKADGEEKDSYNQRLNR